MMYRQGDVLLKKVNKIPKGLKKKNNVLALGEITGHSHKFRPKLETVNVFEQPTTKEQFVEVTGDQAELIHEDHENIWIQPGKYEVKLQREFDIVEGIRQVAD